MPHKKSEKPAFEELMKNLQMGIFRQIPGSDGKIVFANSMLCNMLGYTDKEVEGISIKDVFVDKKLYSRVFKNAEKDQDGIREDIELVRKDGRHVVCTLSLVAVKDSKKKVKFYDGILADITGLVRRDRELQESRELFRTVFDNSAAAIIVTDKDHSIVAWNPYAEKMLGMTKEDFFNKPIEFLYPDVEKKKIANLKFGSDGDAEDVETQVLQKNGTALDVMMSLSLIHNSDGSPVGIIAIINDITKQIQSQNMLLKAKIVAEEANTAKSLFLANMSHEVRTPMNTIIGMIDLSLDTDLNDEQRDNLETAKSAAEILLTLLNDILDLSRVEAGKIQLEKIGLNLTNIANSVCKGLSVMARQKTIELVPEVDEKIPEHLIGDPVRIRQVLVNLINNAIKFTFQGQIKITVKLHQLNGEECEVLFAVADQGVGIPADKLEDIFKTFSQADISTTRKFGGSGLGLAISRRLVEMMGGKVWAESTEFQGSTFYFTVKFKVASGQGGRIPQESVEQEEDGDVRQLPADLRVLLAEDNVVNQKMAVRMLEKKGWFVQAVDNGQKVLDLLNQESFDVILMDAQMPVMDGLEATKNIRRNEKSQGGHIPIVALTARAMAGDRKRCMDAGMDGYVTKPIDREKLFDSIRKALPLHSGGRA